MKRMQRYKDVFHSLPSSRQRDSRLFSLAPTPVFVASESVSPPGTRPHHFSVSILLFLLRSLCEFHVFVSFMFSSSVTRVRVLT